MSRLDSCWNELSQRKFSIGFSPRNPFYLLKDKYIILILEQVVFPLSQSVTTEKFIDQTQDFLIITQNIYSQQML